MIQPQTTARMPQGTNKLERFFGEPLYPDISLPSIQKHGLPALLRSKTPLSFFLAKLLKDHTSENLFFVLHVSDYEEQEFDSESDRHKAAIHLFKLYLAQGAPLELNVNDKIRSFIQARLDNASDLESVFNSAKSHVLELLCVSYLSFTSSSIHERMVQHLTGTIVFEQRGRDVATHLLLSQLNALEDKMKEESAKKHFNVIKHVVHDFIRVALQGC